jgi:hypothetical protein
MIFLIEYDRDRGRIVKIDTFKDSDRETAEQSRLNLELNNNVMGIDNEVVLLEATNEEAVRRTHRRYFEDLRELTSAPSR